MEQSQIIVSWRPQVGVVATNATDFFVFFFFSGKKHTMTFVEMDVWR